MADRGKVKYDIERCICHVPDACRDCSHYKHGEYLDCMEELLKDALSLLKEQDAVEPYQYDAVWLCGNCEKEVVGWNDDIDGKENRYPFCRQCGKPVKWE